MATLAQLLRSAPNIILILIMSTALGVGLVVLGVGMDDRM